MKEKIKITKVAHFIKNRDGGALVNREGRPYTRCLVSTEDGRTLSGFGNQTTKSWKTGDVVELDVVKNGNYYNFKIPKVDIANLQTRIEELEKTVKEQGEKIKQLEDII